MATTHLSPAEFKQRAKKHVPESDVQCAILQWLALMGIAATRIDTTGLPVRGANGTVRALRSPSHVGTPDILGWLPWGQGFAIEVKRPGVGLAGLRRSQAAWIVEQSQRSPWMLVVVASSLRDVEEAFSDLIAAWREVRTFEPQIAVTRMWTHVASGPWKAFTAKAVEAATMKLKRNIR